MLSHRGERLASFGIAESLSRDANRGIRERQLREPVFRRLKQEVQQPLSSLRFAFRETLQRFCRGGPESMQRSSIVIAALRD